MMIMKSRILFLLLALLTTIGAVSAQSPARDAETFEALIKQMTDAQIAFDPATLDKILAPDYIEISPTGDPDSREKVLSFYGPENKPEPGKSSINLEITEHSIRSYGIFAVVIARFNYRIEAEGKSLPPRSLRVTVVFRKEKNAWKLTSTQYTGIRIMPAAKPAVTN